MHNNMNVNVSGPMQPSSQYKTVVLKGQVPFATQVTEPNTKYVIKHNFDLSDGAIVYEGWEIEGMGGNPSVIDGEEYWLSDYESGIAEPTTYNLVDNECFFVIDGHISDTKEVTLQYEEVVYIATKRRGYHARILSHLDPNAAITIPEGCLLEFDGGSLSNGTVIFSDTKIEGNPKILCDVSGTIDKADISWFGAVSEDDTVDCAPIINKVQAITKHLIIPEGTFYVKTASLITNSLIVDWNGTIVYDGISTDIRVVTLKNMFLTLNMAGKLINQSASTSYVDATITNITGLVLDTFNYGNIILGQINGFNTGLMCIGDGGGFANNKIFVSYINNNNIGILITQDNGGWSNENLFIGGKIAVQSSWPIATSTARFIVAKKIFNTDTYNKVNSLYFLKLNLESHLSTIIPIELHNASRVKIEHCRFEGISTCAAKLYGTCDGVSIPSSFGTNYIDYTDSNIGITNSPIDIPNVNEYVHTHVVIKDHVSFVDNVPKAKSLIFGGSYNTNNGVFESPNALGYDINTETFSKVLLKFDCNNSNDPKAIRIFTKRLSPTPSNDRCYISGKAVHSGEEFTQDDILYGGMSLTNKGNYWATGSYANNLTIFIKPATKILYIILPACSEFDIFLPTSVTFIPNHPLHVGNTSQRPVSYIHDGYKYFDENLKKNLYYANSRWNENDGAIAGVRRLGLNSQKPSLANIYDGFEYFDYELARKVVYGLKKADSYSASKYISAGSSSMVENDIAAGKYVVTINRSNIRSIYACKTNTYNEETDILILYSSSSNFVGEAEMPNPSEYPYLYFTNLGTAAASFVFYELSENWYDFDGALVGVNRSGISTNRPTGSSIYVGFMYMDTTLGKPIYASAISGDTVTWVDATGATV